MIRITIDEFDIKDDKIFYQKLSDSKKEKFVSLYSAYSNILLNFLDKEYNISGYDKMFEEYKFEPINEGEYDTFQKISSEYSKYLYLRNELYIERLSDDELDWLKNRIEKNNFELDQDAKDFILNTFNIVVLENYLADYNIFYGPNNYRFIKPCNALVFGVRYDEFDLKDNKSEKEWIKLHHKQLFSLEIIESFIHDKINKSLGIPVEFIKYDENSIKKNSDIIDDADAININKSL